MSIASSVSPASRKDAEAIRHRISRPALYRAGLVLVVGIFSASDASAAKRKITCSMEPARRAEVRSIDERLDLTLTDGTVLKLAGIEPVFPTPDAPSLDLWARSRLSARLAGREIAFRALGERTDRWGRVPALIFSEAGSPHGSMVSVAAAVLEAGLGRFSPADEVHACRAQFLAAENLARTGKLGLWADPYYAVIAANDSDALYEKTGTSVIVEGRVIGVDTGRFRTRLSLGQKRGRDLLVTIASGDMEKLREAGLEPGTLEGKILRIRGLLDAKLGPRIEVSSPDAIEVVPTVADSASNPAPVSPAR
jgi:hypothetical protein